jgi:hypothetical protein
VQRKKWRRRVQRKQYILTQTQMFVQNEFLTVFSNSKIKVPIRFMLPQILFKIGDIIIVCCNRQGIGRGRRDVLYIRCTLHKLQCRRC